MTLDINGCRIVSVLNADAEDGFLPTVSRYVGLRNPPSDDELPKDAVKVSRGPFATIRAAIEYAKTWNDAETPPPMPVPKPKSEPTIETASESIAIQIEPPSENPPLAEDQ